jgi:hypothetical protein
MDMQYNVKIDWMLIAEFYNRHLEICKVSKKRPSNKDIDHILDVWKPVKQLKRIFLVKVDEIYLREKEENLNE